MKKVAILQSNYIPWKGYFDLIASVDEFIIYDEVQYTKNDWRNRNRIKTRNGVEWITIPVRTEKLSQSINQTQTFTTNWTTKHVKTIQANYSKAKHFNEYSPFIFELYNQASKKLYLTEINYIFIKNICELLNITTTLSFSTDYNLIGGKTERLVNLCNQVGATNYISGPSAKTYIDNSQFEKNNVGLEWMNYSNYKEYNQLFLPFEHGVSILDLIFNEGINSRNFLKY